MSVFITKQLRNVTSSEAFQKRGLSGHVSVKAAEGGLVALSVPDAGSTLLYANLHFELFGRLEGKATIYNSFRTPVQLLHRLGDPMFEWPLLTVSVKNGGETMNTLGMFEAGTGKQGVYAGTPNAQNLAVIAGLVDDYYETLPAGNVNVAGYMAFIMAWRGVRAFFACGGGVGGVQSFVVSEEGGKKIGGTPAVDPLYDEDGSLKRDGRPEKKAGGLLAIGFMNVVSGSKKAREVTVLDVGAVSGDIGVVGYTFPFFKEMLEADPDSTFNIFQRLFHHCYATPETIGEAVPLYRRGFRYLSSTTAGKILQHIYFLMDLSIQLRGEISLLRDGTAYVGAVIATKETLIHKNRSLQPVDVGPEIAKLNEHGAACDEVYDILIEFARMDGKAEEITKSQLRENPRYLRKMVIDREPTDVDPVRQEINERISNMKYQQTYWEINDERVVLFLKMLHERSNMLNEPMYVHIDVVFDRTNGVLEYLSVFGGQGPSVYYGDVIRKVKPLGEDDPNLVVTNGTRSLQHVPYQKKGLIAASRDWNSVRREKAIRFVGKKEGKQSGKKGGFSDTQKRDGVITGKMFDPFYSTLRAWIYAGVKEKMVVGKGKKREVAEMDAEDEVDQSPPKKNKFTFV